MSSQWYQTYEVNFGKKLDQHDVDSWEEELNARIKNILPGETKEAVRAIADEYRKDGKKKYPPTVNQVITQIIRARYELREQSNARVSSGSDHQIIRPENEVRDFGAYYNERAREWNQRLSEAVSPDAAWSIICEPSTPEECRERETYCIQNSIPYRRWIQQRRAA
jgi:hypothetical protein